VTDQRELAVELRPRARVSRDFVELVEQLVGAAGEIDDAAVQRQSVAAVAGEIEGDGEIAVARQRRRDGRHHLLRAREAVRDDHDGLRRPLRRREYRRRDHADGDGPRRHAVLAILQPNQRVSEGANGENEDNQPQVFHRTGAARRAQITNIRARLASPATAQ